MREIDTYSKQLTLFLALFSIIIGFFIYRSHKKHELFITKTEESIKVWYPVFILMRNIAYEVDQKKKSKQFIELMNLLKGDNSPLITENDYNTLDAYDQFFIQYHTYCKVQDEKNLRELWKRFSTFNKYVKNNLFIKNSIIYFNHSWYEKNYTSSLFKKIISYLFKYSLEILELIFKIFTIMTLCSGYCYLVFRQDFSFINDLFFYSLITFLSSTLLYLVISYINNKSIRYRVREFKEDIIYYYHEDWQLKILKKNKANFEQAPNFEIEPVLNIKSDDIK